MGTERISLIIFIDQWSSVISNYWDYWLLLIAYI